MTTGNGVGFVIFCICSLQLFSISACLTPSYLRIKSSCAYDIWPVISSNPDSPVLSSDANTGFSLRPGEAKTVALPPGWSGIVWGRTLCTNSLDGHFFCVTGDCGSSTLACPSGTTTAATPLTTTLAVFATAAAVDGQLYTTYFVSLTTGYNLPMTVVPRGGTGRDCRATGCTADLNKGCPEELRVMHEDVRVGCNMVDCQDPHDCSGLTGYFNFFKTTCPLAYSSSNGHSTSTTFACLSAAVDYMYDVTFCASGFPTNSNTYEREEYYKRSRPSSDDETRKKPNQNLIFIVASLGSSMGVVVVLGCACVFVIRRRSETETDINQSTTSSTTTHDTYIGFGCSMRMNMSNVPGWNIEQAAPPISTY
ncbi:thaumatin-like protein 1b [Humulus lupulus]|uniref:thaumatin-like protein 1b n=1 Tax=Humulus lupulus TaxID=3486 RepID=UPI002B406E91|nr:thaumatin-like protein 1b [Humulus lupulus]